MGVLLGLPTATAAPFSEDTEPAAIVVEISPAAAAIPGSSLQTRAELGLDNSAANLNAVVTDQHPESEEILGIPLSRAEFGILADRFEFQDAIHNELVPFLNSLESVGGFYLDRTDGSLVIGVLQELREHDVLEIERLLPAGPGFRLEFVEHSESELRSVVRELTEAWDQLVVNARFIAISADFENQQVTLEVEAGDRARASELVESRYEDSEDVPVQVAVGTPDFDSACTSRDSCFSPSRAGNRIRRGGVNSNAKCSMGFHIKRNNLRQFVTSGHCNWKKVNGSWPGTEIFPTPTWYHQAYGGYGKRQSTLYTSYAVDIMRVAFPNTQASDLLYNGSSQPVGSSRHPTNSEFVCSTRGNSDTVSCGYLTTTYQTYTSNTCACTMIGAKVGYAVSANPGDSGSPVYSAFLTGNKRVALGVHATNNGRFARMQDALTFWGWTVVGS